MLLPDELFQVMWDQLPPSLGEARYAKVIMKLADLLDKEFFEHYVKTGTFPFSLCVSAAPFVPGRHPEACEVGLSHPSTVMLTPAAGVLARGSPSPEGIVESVLPQIWNPDRSFAPPATLRCSPMLRHALLTCFR